MCWMPCVCELICTYLFTRIQRNGLLSMDISTAFPYLERVGIDQSKVQIGSSMFICVSMGMNQGIVKRGCSVSMQLQEGNYICMLQGNKGTEVSRFPRLATIPGNVNLTLNTPHATKTYVECGGGLEDIYKNDDKVSE